MVVLRRKSHRRDLHLDRILSNSQGAVDEFLVGLPHHQVTSDVERKLERYLRQDSQVPEGIDPAFGKLQPVRAARKRLQCASLARHFTGFAHSRCKTVEFGCGSGHLSLLLAWLFPRCTFILVERKEYTCSLAAKRVQLARLSNCHVMEGSVETLISQRQTFDVAITLHSCGLFTDEILKFCEATHAQFMLCPCCYGQLVSDMDRFLDQSRSSDQKQLSLSRQDLDLVARGADLLSSGQVYDPNGDTWFHTAKRCMRLIDALRLRGLRKAYVARMTDLAPLSCSPKNNVIIGSLKAESRIGVTGYEDYISSRAMCISELFKTYEMALPPNYELIKSRTSDFRLRCRFAVLEERPASMEFGVFKEGRAVALPLEQLKCHLSFECADIKIQKLMLWLRDKLGRPEYQYLSLGLTAIHFLTTLCSTGKTLVTLIYSAHVNEIDWNCAAQRLKREVVVETNLQMELIGRAKRQAIVQSQDFVDDRLTCGKEVLYYRQLEGVFSNPNGYVNEKVLTWLYDKCATIPNVRDLCLLELYCGNCNHSVAISPLFKSILAVEVERKLCEAARLNVTVNARCNISIVQGDADAEFFHRKSNGELIRCDVILVDPPRRGLGLQTIKALATFKHVIYISCNPKALIHDIGSSQLEKSHEIVNAAIIDHFPYTRHVEVAVMYSRKLS